MWFTLFLFAASFLLSALLAPKPKIENARAGNMSDIQLPRATEGDPVPWVIGTVRQKGPNTLWSGDFDTDKITKKVKTGLFSSKQQTVGYKYKLGFDLALCMGPGVSLLKVWAGKKVLWQGIRSTVSTFGMGSGSFLGGEDQRGGFQGTVTFFPGNFDQGRSSYLQQKCHSLVPAYNGICHLVFHRFYIGNSPQLEQLSFELQRLPNDMGLTGGIHIVNGKDANPICALYDGIVNNWGRLGISLDSIDLDSWKAAAVTCHAEGNGINVLVDRANDGKDVIEEILRQIDGIMYQDSVTGKVKIALIRQDYVLDQLPLFGPHNTRELSNYTVQTWDETYNEVRVNYSNRAKDYANSSALVQDFANISMQGRVKSTSLSFPWVCDNQLATNLAQRQLNIQSIPLMKCTLVVTRVGQSLRPGSCFLLNWPEYNIVRAVMRVHRIDLGELVNGRIVLECMQDRFATGATTFGPPDAGLWQPIADEASIIQRQVSDEVPYRLLMLNDDRLPPVGTTRLMSMAQKPSSASQNFSVEHSLDDFVTSSQLNPPQEYAEVGILLADYPASAGFAAGLDTVGFSVSGLTFPEDLEVIAVDDVRQGKNLIMVDKEIMGFTGWQDQGNGAFRLTGVRRGLMDTAIASHTTGASVFFITAYAIHENEILYPADNTIKLIDHTALGVSLLEAIEPVEVAASGRPHRPLPPDYLTVNGSRTPAKVTANPIALAWRERNRLTETQISFEDDASVSPEAGTTYTVRWRKDSGSWTVVSSLTTPDYSLNVGPAFGQIDVEVLAYRNNLSSYSASQISFTAETILPVSNTVPPSISGDPILGATLTASRGTWVETTGYSYQWIRDGQPITGAIETTYVPTTADLDKQLNVLVTGSNAGGSKTVGASPVGPVERASGYGNNYGFNYGEN